MRFFTRMGYVQFYSDIAAMLNHMNRHGNWYEIRNGNEVWHKGHNTLAGKFESKNDEVRP